MREVKNSSRIIWSIITKKGYLLSFNFNRNEKTGVNEIRIGDKVIVEAVV